MRYVRGDEVPLSVVLGLAQAAEIPVSWLITGEEPRPAGVVGGKAEGTGADASAGRSLFDRSDDKAAIPSQDPPETQREHEGGDMFQIRGESGDMGDGGGLSGSRSRTGGLELIDPSRLRGAQAAGEDALRADWADTAVVLLPRLEVQMSAGSGLVPADEAVRGLMAFQASYLRAIGVNPRHAYVLPVSGDSMVPTLCDQDLVVIDTSIDRVVDDALYAVVHGGSVRVKRVQLARDGSVILSSDNKDAGYRDERIPASDLHELKIVGRVRGHYHTL
ncbi:S24 family peptidase [Jiella sp. MQZ9-1]|nr:S24 family peptidase [Jiella flava]MCD2472737.1 S24 family peptidase [Jiella flava]